MKNSTVLYRQKALYSTSKNRGSNIAVLKYTAGNKKRRYKSIRINRVSAINLN